MKKLDEICVVLDEEEFLFERTSISGSEELDYKYAEPLAKAIGYMDYINLGEGMAHMTVQVREHAFWRIVSRGSNLSGLESVISNFQSIVANPEVAARLLLDAPINSPETPSKGEVILWDSKNQAGLIYVLRMYQGGIVIKTVLNSRDGFVGAEEGDLCLYVGEDGHCVSESLSCDGHFRVKPEIKNR